MTILQPISIPLSIANRQLALALSQTQKVLGKSKQLRLNILGACAVEQYFSYLDIETTREESDSFDAIQQSLINSAALMLSNLGKVECRPVLAGQDFMFVPPETWSDRIGYIAVQLNEELTEGKILGFVKTVSHTQVPIKSLRSLDEFLDYLETLEPLLLNLRDRIVQLTQSGWELVSDVANDIFSEATPDAKWAFRSQSIALMNQGVTCQKQLNQIPFRISLYPRTGLDYDYDVIVKLSLEKLASDTINQNSSKKFDGGQDELYVAILGEDRAILREETLNVRNEKIHTALILDMQGDQGDQFIIKVDYQGHSMEEIMNL